MAWAVVAGLVALAAPRSMRAQDVGLEIGSRPAPVSVQDLDGKPVNLAKYLGKGPVLIEFWATWCPLCRALEPQMTSLTKRYGKRMTVLVMAVGVNQTPRSIKRHLQKHALPGVVLWDGEGAAVRAFEAPGTSYVVLLDASGKVVYTGAGSEQKLLAAAAKAL